MEHKKVCEICDTNFTSKWKHTLTCSFECRKRRNAQLAGRAVREDYSVPSGSIGAMSEMFVSAELLRRGYAVFRSLSPSCFCDLIVYKDKQPLTMEVRTGYLNIHTKKLFFPSKPNGDVDLWGVYERNTGRVHFLDKNKSLIEL